MILRRKKKQEEAEKELLRAIFGSTNIGGVINLVLRNLERFSDYEDAYDKINSEEEITKK